MQHLARFALRHIYYHGLAVGALNFEFDFSAQTARATRRVSVYAIFANIAMACIFPVLYCVDLNMTLRPEHLKYFIFTLLTIIRLTCVLLTFMGNWWNRDKVMTLLRDSRRLHRRYFRQLLLRHPSVVRKVQIDFVTKYLLVILIEVLMFAISLRESRLALTARVYFGLLLVSQLTSTMSLVFLYGVLSIMTVNLHYDLLKCELADILNDISAMLAQPQQQQQQRHRLGFGIFATKCCQLADRVDAMARAERQLHVLCDRMSQMYALQTCCVVLTIYVSSVASIFFTYTVLTYSNHIHCGLKVDSVTLIAICWFAFLKDMRISFFTFFHLLDLRRECSELLRTYLQLPPMLDMRLENSFQNLMLQLQGRPIILNALGLFELNKLFFFSMFGSLVQHSIVLIQYNIKISL